MNLDENMVIKPVTENEVKAKFDEFTDYLKDHKIAGVVAVGTGGANVIGATFGSQTDILAMIASLDWSSKKKIFG
jgi:hypothetical protein